MGVTVAVTRAAANTGTGNQTFSTTDLGGLTPKAVILIATRCVTDATAADGAGFYWGLSDGTNEATGSYESQHAQTSMDNIHTQGTTADRILTIHDGTADSVVEATADFVSFGSNGVTINWTDAPAAAYLVTAIFFAGTDLSVIVGRQDLGTTADALIANTSVGFEADNVIVFWNHTLDGGGMSFGFAHNDRAGTVTQRCVVHNQRTTFSSSRVNVQMRDGEAVAKLQPTEVLDYMGAFQSFDSAGWDVQLGNTRNPASADYAYLALRYGASPVVSSKVYTYSTPTGTGSNTDSTPNFTPQFVMYLACRAAAADTNTNDANGGTVGIVVADADEVYSNSIGDEDAAADSNTQSLSNASLNLPTHTGGSGHTATLTSLGATGPVWNFSATDTSVVRLWPALAIETSSISPTTIVLDTAALAASGQALDVVPGAITKTLDTALLTAGGQTLDVVNVNIVVLDTAFLTAGGQALDVIPGAVSKTLDTAILTASGQALDVVPGAVTKILDTALLTANGIAITISAPAPGISITLDTAALTAAGQALDVVPGAFSLALDTASLAANGITITISAPAGGTTVVLDTALLTASGQILDVVPGAITKTLDTALLTASGPQLDVVPGAVIKLLDTAILTAAGNSLTIVPGSVIISIDTAALTANGQTISISAISGVAITLDTALLVATARTIALRGYAVTVRTWTLRERDLAWTLDERDINWSLHERDTTWTIDDR